MTDLSHFLTATGMPQSAQMSEPYEILALSKDSRVLRYGRIPGTEQYGYWYLELPTDAVDMGRVNAGTAPLLYAHGWQHLGVITGGKSASEGLRLSVRWTSVPDEGELTADQKFAKELWRGVQEKTRNAYSIRWNAPDKALQRVGEEDGRPVFRATVWELQEASLVDIGADGRASSMLSLSAEENFADAIEALEGQKMNEIEKLRAEMTAEMDAKLAAQAIEHATKLAIVKAEGAAKDMQTRGLLAAGDDVAAKFAPAIVAVPDLETLLAERPAAAAAAVGAGKLPLEAPPVGAGKKFSVDRVLEKAKVDGVNPYALISDEE